MIVKTSSVKNSEQRQATTHYADEENDPPSVAAANYGVAGEGIGVYRRKQR
jgi:hypothetical protein